MSALALSLLVESSKRPYDDSKHLKEPGRRDDLVGWIDGLQLPCTIFVGAYVLDHDWNTFRTY